MQTSKSVNVVFARARCGDCGDDCVIAFSCNGRRDCPACNPRRMAETAAHRAAHLLPRVPVRPWVLSVPKRLRYPLQHDREALNGTLRMVLQ
ncbi:transposase zinc-binding domain-containing protein [Aquisalimonas sp.]|uniref:transposase zinc-binding domain-containing protein n=1 Tax=Aquisalimonas sp. TaxID=1872621 RepID=UPI0025C737D8|nr:transposase zinc-binding domain-containing protein [Aquisalimonas sp.]